MVAMFTACSLGAAVVLPEPAGRDLTTLNDVRHGEGVLGPFARRDRAQRGLPTPEEELSAHR